MLFENKILNNSTYHRDEAYSKRCKSLTSEGKAAKQTLQTP